MKFVDLGARLASYNRCGRGGYNPPNCATSRKPVGWVERQRNPSSGRRRSDGFRCRSTHPTSYNTSSGRG